MNNEAISFDSLVPYIIILIVALVLSFLGVLSLPLWVDGALR